MLSGSARAARTVRWLVLPALLLVGSLLLGGAAATGAGYGRDYSVAAISEVPSDIDIVAVTTSGPSGGNITGTFQVSGQIDLSTEADMYAVYIDGTSSNDAIAWITYTDNPRDGTFYNSTIIPPTNEPVSLNGDGSTMTFRIPVADVGPASSFAVNVYALHDGQGTSTNSWLGTNYANGRDQLCNDTSLQCVLISSGTGSGGSGGTGTPGGNAGSSGSSGPSSGSISGDAWIYGVVAVVVVVVVAAIAIVMRRRGQPGRPPSGSGGTSGWAPPPPPPPR
jgi:hypothetical protein